MNVSFDNQTINGYVLCSQVLLSTISSPKRELDYNATLKQRARLFGYEELKFVDLEMDLEVGQQIKILGGYNSSNEFTRIQYLDSSGDIFTAYVKTIDIQTSGISKTTIGAIIIIITTISLVLIVFGVKGKRKKRKIN